MCKNSNNTNHIKYNTDLPEYDSLKTPTTQTLITVLLWSKKIAEDGAKAMRDS